jgi:DNA-binding YbaB/EbfC family protein
MKNLGQMMKQAQEMQAKMGEMQTRLADLQATGQSGAGMVTVTLNGKGEMRAVKLDPKLMDPSEVEVLEDLIVAATNDAKAKIESAVQAETAKLMGGLKLPPGFTLPT